MPNVLDIHLELVDVWNRRDWNHLRSLLHRNYRHNGPGSKELAGRGENIDACRAFASAFPDGKLEIKDTYLFANTSIAELHITGTHLGELMGIPPSGRKVEADLCHIIEVRNGKVYREREYIDMLDLMAQLGVLRSPIKKASAA